MPEIGVSETLVLMCNGDNRFGQLGVGQTGPEGQAAKKVRQKLFKSGYPLQVRSSQSSGVKPNPPRNPSVGPESCIRAGRKLMA